jgi:hypothetical protein
LFDPWFSNDGAACSDGPVASVRVQAADVRVATARDAITSHFVVERGIGGFLSEELES